MQLLGSGAELSSAVLEFGGPVGELAGPVGGLHDPVMDGGEADVDVVEVLLEHVGAQGVGQRRAHRFGEVAADVVDRVDRKSTRLNSSHVAISYAVFCLKKKKKNTKHEIQLKKEN